MGGEIDADGGKYNSNNAGSYTTSYLDWLTRGKTDQVWCERTLDSGGPLAQDDIGAGRTACTSDLETGVLDPIATGSPTVAVVTIDFYDAASSGNLLATAVLNLDAERL